MKIGTLTILCSDRLSGRSRIGTRRDRANQPKPARSDRLSGRSRIGTSAVLPLAPNSMVAIGFRVDRGLEQQLSVTRQARLSSDRLSGRSRIGTVSPPPH